MKKLWTGILTLVFSFYGWAQEEAEAAPEKYEFTEWGETTLRYALASFIIFMLILIARTFRNKPSA
jgi:hypothetical protein